MCLSKGITLNLKLVYVKRSTYNYPLSLDRQSKSQLESGCFFFDRIPFVKDPPDQVNDTFYEFVVLRKLCLWQTSVSGWILFVVSKSQSQEAIESKLHQKEWNGREVSGLSVDRSRGGSHRFTGVGFEGVEHFDVSTLHHILFRGWVIITTTAEEEQFVVWIWNWNPLSAAASSI